MGRIEKRFDFEDDCLICHGCPPEAAIGPAPPGGRRSTVVLTNDAVSREMLNGTLALYKIREELFAVVEFLAVTGVVQGCKLIDATEAAKLRQCAAGGAELNRDQPSIIKGPFGLSADCSAKTVAMGDKTVDLSRSVVQWHYFSVVLAAAPKQASKDELQKDYPGEWDARATVVTELNRKLLRLGVKVADRTLHKLPTHSRA